jgi:hypothetical protein
MCITNIHAQPQIPLTRVAETAGRNEVGEGVVPASCDGRDVVKLELDGVRAPPAVSAPEVIALENEEASTRMDGLALGLHDFLRRPLLRTSTPILICELTTR